MMPVINGGHALADSLSLFSSPDVSIQGHHEQSSKMGDHHNLDLLESQAHENSSECCGAVCVAIQFTPDIPVYREKPPISGPGVIGDTSTYCNLLVRPPKDSLV